MTATPRLFSDDAKGKPAQAEAIICSMDDYKVEKMRFPRKDQKDTIFYNSNITISNLPAEAYE